MGECYAELGMTDVADNAGWQTCLFIPGFCNFVVGDGTGGTEQFIMETATAAECVNTVLEYHPEANGATYQSDGTACCTAPPLLTLVFKPGARALAAAKRSQSSIALS